MSMEPTEWNRSENDRPDWLLILVYGLELFSQADTFSTDSSLRLPWLMVYDSFSTIKKLKKTSKNSPAQKNS